MNRTQIMNLCQWVIVILGIYALAKHVLWVIEYTTKTGFSPWPEVPPLLINLLYFIPAFVIYKLKKSGFSFDDYLFWMAILCPMLILGGLYMAEKATDPLEAELPILMIVFPFLFIFSILGYAKSKQLKSI